MATKTELGIVNDRVELVHTAVIDRVADDEQQEQLLQGLASTLANGSSVVKEFQDRFAANEERLDGHDHDLQSIEDFQMSLTGICIAKSI